MGADAASQSGPWLASAGAAPRRVNFRPALNKDQGMLLPYQHPSSSSLPRPLNSVMAAKSNNRACPTAASPPIHEPLSWTPAPRIGAGLSNLGNTCFLNSVLQCLTYTPPLAGYLDSGQHKATCRAAGFCAMCALQEHVRQALASSGGAVSPSTLVKNLRCISKSFRMWRQEDAHEYLRCLIEGLHNCCLPPGVKSNSAVSQERSLIHKIFGGRLRSQVKCTVCLTCSNTYDPLLDLSLEIVRADSLTKALNRFTAVEALEGDNKYHCSHCNKKVRALKQFTIDKPPNILTIQFKRFSSTGSSGGKIDKKIEFGRTLDLKPYISNPQATDAKYSLYAVLVHAGWSTHSGHYYCFVRTKGDMWHALDDSRVKQVSEKSVLDQKAYILFYIRDSPTRSSVVTDQRLQSTLPAFKKLLSDGAAEVADDSSADDLDNNSTHRGSNAGNADGSLNRTNGIAQVAPDSGLPAAPNANLPSVKPAGNSQIPSESNTADTTNVAKNIAIDTYGPITTNNSLDVKMKTDNATEKLTKIASIEKKDVLKANVNGLAAVENLVKEIHSNGLEASAPSTGNADVATAVSDKLSSAEEFKNQEDEDIDCSTSGEDEDEDWNEYTKPLNSCTSHSYMRLLYAMPHTRRYFMARALPVQRDRKRSACKKVRGQVENGHCEGMPNGLSSNDKISKRLCCTPGDGGFSKRQKLVDHREESRSSDEMTAVVSTSAKTNGLIYSGASSSHGGKSNGHANKSESDDVTVLRERLQADGSCQAEDLGGSAPATVATGDPGKTGLDVPTKDGSRKSTAALQHSSPDSSKKSKCNGLGVSNPVDGCLKGAVSSPKSSTRLQPNGLYDFEVPRWGEVEANENGSLKDVDRLLRMHKTVVPERDAWDEEYDRGKAKKVRIKATFDVGNGANPFQMMAEAAKNSKQRLHAPIKNYVDE